MDPDVVFIYYRHGGVIVALETGYTHHSFREKTPVRDSQLCKSLR